MAAQFSLMKGASAARADVVNRARDQLLARTGFSLDKNGGIRRRDALDLFEHRFQSRTIADELLESARISVLLTELESLRQLPQKTSWRPRTLSYRA